MYGCCTTGANVNTLTLCSALVFFFGLDYNHYHFNLLRNKQYINRINIRNEFKLNMQNCDEEKSNQPKNVLAKKSKEKKTLKVQIGCPCKRECSEQIDVLRQQDIFNEYHKTSDWPSQTRFLRSLVSVRPIKNKLDPVIALKKKDNSYQYHFINESGSLTQVCLQFFLKVLQIDRCKVFRAVDSINKNPCAKENRGGATTHRTSSADMKFLKEFIQKFVVYESSSKPQKSSPKYLHPRLFLRQMYLLYSEDCAFKKRKTISDTTFRKVVHDSKLKLFRKSQQKCEQCKDGDDLNDESNAEPNEHIKIVKSVKDDLISSVENANMPEEKTEVLTFKLHRAIDLPLVSSNDAFFKRQLWCSIFTIYDHKADMTYFYVWDESVASRGSPEIVSCLYKYFVSNLPKDTKKVILFSDPNLGQTRNITVSLMLSKYFDYSKCPELTTIEQHFFSPGHCTSSCDRSFQSISSLIEADKIFVQADIVNAIKNGKKNNSNFVVTTMSRKNFISPSPLMDLLNDTKEAVDGTPIRWPSYQKLIYNRDAPFSLDVAEYGASTIKTITLKRKFSIANFSATNLTYLYTGPRAISKLKYDDLQTLMKHVPNEHHEYYRSLNHDQNNSIEDFALAENDSDDEI